VPRQTPPATGTVHQFVAGEAEIGSIGRFNERRHSSRCVRRSQDVMEDLIALAQPLQDSVVVWRGVRSIDDTFGVPAERLDDLIGNRRASAQFLATSADRGTAEREFSEPATRPRVPHSF
jgi:hypothetical protein